MNSRENIAKILFKVDSYVDRSANVFITKNITSNTQNVNSLLVIGQSNNDNKNVNIEQKINEETLEIEDASLYTPNLIIGKNNKLIVDTTDDDNIIATKSYVDAHTSEVDLSNYDKLVKITNENNELTSKKITLNNNEINNVSISNDGSDNDKIIPSLSKVQALISAGGISLDGYSDIVNITNINNQLTTKNITLNSKLINDISKKDNDDTNDNKTLPTLSKVNELINNVSIDLSNYDNLVKITNANNELTTKKITLNNNEINDLVKKGNDAENDDKIYSQAKVDELINNVSIDLSNYDDLVKITNTNNELTTKKIILSNDEITNISKKDNDDTLDNKTLPTLSKVNDLINSQSIDLSNYDDLVKITNSNNELTTKKITLNNNEINELVKKGNDAINDDKIYSQAKVDELIETIDMVGKKEYDTTDPEHPILKGEIFNIYEGNNKNTASGEYSHAEGYKTSALGDNTFTSGKETIADKNEMFVIGKYNIYNENDPTINNNKLFVVGNGEDNTHRNDAFVVKDNGNVIVNNDLKTTTLTIGNNQINSITAKQDDYTPDNETIPTLATVNDIIAQSGGGTVDLSHCVKNDINQELTNKFVFNNVNNEYTGKKITLNNKEINDVVLSTDTEPVNDLDNIIPSYAKIKDIDTNNIKKNVDYIESNKLTNKFVFDNVDNELVAKLVKTIVLNLNNKEIIDIIKNNDNTEDDKKLYTVSKMNNDFVKKSTDSGEQTINDQLNIVSFSLPITQ